MLPFTPFIGRENEFTDIQTILAEPNCQLLTLVGPGGIGKTRLALQIQSRLDDQFKHGTAVIHLEPLRSAEFFLTTIADAFHFSLASHETPLQQLGRFLADKEMLIVFDNFEHILEATEPLIQLLPLTPHIKYLVTSREPLNLQEERLYPITGLTFPVNFDGSAENQSYDALQLFEERAKRGYPNFSLEAEQDSVIKICQLVDGMPLAIELAAAWRRTLNCQAIAAEIQRDLEFLSTRLRNVPERHQSIQAIFDQTWSQLLLSEQNVFKRLSVFRGGFHQDAAVTVTEASPRILSALMEKCLIRIDENGRFYHHELLRQYGAEQLEISSEETDQAHADHASFYINYLKHRLSGTTGHRQLKTISEIHDELDNIRVAWSWTVAQLDYAALYDGGAPLGMYYQLSGNYIEGLRQFSQAAEVILDQPQSDNRDRALIAILICRSWFLLRSGRIDETEMSMRQCYEIYQRLDIPFRNDYTSDPLSFLGIIEMIKGNFAEAEQFADQARRRAQKENNLFNLQFAYKILSDVHLSQGQIDQAQKYAQDAYAVVQDTGDEWFMAYILNNLGQIALIKEDMASAKVHFSDSYTIRHAFDDPEMGVASNHLANIALKEQSFSEAEARFNDSLKIYQNINDKGGVAVANRGLGIVALAQADFEKSQSYFRQALQLGMDINLRTFLLALLVDIAELMWQAGRRKRPLSILTFAAQHDATEHDANSKATQLLALYKLAVAPSIFSEATHLENEKSLIDLCSELLYELSLPIIAQKPKTASPQPDQPLFDALTPRELEVLGLMANGRSNPEIANQLIISVGTVKAYTNKIFSKLGVRNRVEAVTRANELNLL